MIHQKFHSYTLLIADVEQILNAIAHEPYIKRPYPMHHDPNTDKTKYYSFHKDHGHIMEQCQKLNDELEFLIRKGYLKEFIHRDQVERRETKAQSSKSKAADKRPIFRVINILVDATKNGPY